MIPATTSTTEAWRRLVWWSRASDRVIVGCVVIVMLTLGGCSVLLVLDAGVMPLLLGAAALGAATEGLRRVCEVMRRRALDAMVQSLQDSRGPSREAIEQAARILPSGRIEELEASLAFEADPVRRAIEAAIGRGNAPLSPLCEPVAGARSVVVKLGHEWAAVLRFERAALARSHVHRRRFAWIEDAGPRPIALSLDAEARALVERSIGRLPASAAEEAPGERAGAVGVDFAIVDGEARTHARTGWVELAGESIARVDGDHGGPYRTATPTAAPIEVAEIMVEGRPRRLASAPPDGRAEDVLVHAVVHAAARAVPRLELAEPLRVVKGRPLRVDGVQRLAGLQGASPWIDVVTPISAGSPAQRSALAQRWLHAARTEHASIAAFERLARVLAELDAPAPLIERARAAMADETRHARDAFSLASAYGGPKLGPDTLEVPTGPPPPIDALAIETFVDGCVGETIAAHEAAAALVRCGVPAARAALVRVAVDERRHAELAWDILAWLLPRTSVAARAIIAGVAPASGGGSSRESGPWLARHGWLTCEEEIEVAIAAWGEEIGPRRAGALFPCRRGVQAGSTQ